MSDPVTPEGRISDLDRQIADDHRHPASSAVREVIALREERDSLAAQIEDAQKREQRAWFIAQHLFGMVPRDVWREHGVEVWGQYEGDHHAAQVQQEIKDALARWDAK